MYEQMGNQGLYLHPKATKNKAEYWRTTKWNAAWMAACVVDSTLRDMANGG